MDPINQNDQKPQDLSRQYQDILDRYTQDLLKKNSPPVETPLTPQPPQTIEVPEIPDVPETPEVNTAILTDVAELPPQLPPAEEPKIIPSSASAEPTLPVSELPPESDDLPPEPSVDDQVPASNVFKYLFYLSLLIFIGVCSAVGYNLYSNLSGTGNNGAANTAPTASPTTVSAPTVTSSPSGPSCSLNDHSYTVGQTFASADGCNTCTCNQDLTISCTEKACEATPSVKLTPTKSATTSATSKTNTEIVNFVKDTVYQYGKDHGLTSKNQIVVTVTKAIGDFATGTTSYTSDVEGSGGGWIIGKVSGKWKMISEFQEPPACKLMTQYKVPKEIYENCN